jgi:phage terminase large subunit-like protein
VSFDVTELAALGHFWEAWARPKQLPPETNWRSFGFVTGRGFGKTRSNCETVIAEIMAGRTKYLGFAAQNLDVAERAMVNGPDGLITRSPPWFRPVLVKGQLIWPNGAVATALTPEVPNGPRNFSFDTVWLAEIAAWPASDAGRVHVEHPVRAPARSRARRSSTRRPRPATRWCAR